METNHDKTEKTLIKLDIGCGTKKLEGFVGLDRTSFPGVDVIHDITKTPWPFENESVSEANCSHVLEHLDHNRQNPERARFMNELYRVLIPGGTARIITPHWCNNRAYGDFTHADKPVSEFFYYYLDRKWRKAEAPDNDIEWNPDGYNCNFNFMAFYIMNPALLSKNQDFQQFAVTNYKDACMDMVATLTKQPM